MATKILGFAKIKICSDQKTDKAKKFLVEKKLFNHEMFIPIENIVDERPFSKLELNDVITVKSPYDKKVKFLVELLSKTIFNNDENKSTAKSSNKKRLNLLMKCISCTRATNRLSLEIPQNYPIQIAIDGEKLKCGLCRAIFDQYCEPQYIPCGNTICTLCQFKIQREAVDKMFKCEACTQYHEMPENGNFPINKETLALIALGETVKRPKSREYEKLELNLNKIEILLAKLNNFEADSYEKLNEHCCEQKRLIQIETELKILKIEQSESYFEEIGSFYIDQIYETNDELFDLVDDYRKNCIEMFSNKTKSIKFKINDLVEVVDDFLEEKRVYLKQFQPNDKEMGIFNKQSLELQSRLNQELNRLINLTFNFDKILFKKNELDESDLGYFDYDTIFNNILSASDDGTIKLWDIDSNECIKTYQANIGIVSCVKYVATGNKMISGYFNGTIKIWNMENDECIKTIDRSHTREIRNILIISNNKFVTCSLDQTIKLFDLNTFECVRTYHVKEIGITNIDKLSNNKIASCSQGYIRIWKLDNEKCFKSIRAYGIKNIKTFSLQKIISQDFKHDGIKIWNVETGLCLKTFRINISTLNSNYFTCIVKLSNQEIAIGESSGTIKIYNKTYDKCLKAFTSLSLNINNNQHKSNTNCVWYLAKLSKNTIASCQSSNYTIEIWNTDSGNCLEKLSGHKNLVTFIALF